MRGRETAESGQTGVNTGSGQLCSQVLGKTETARDFTILQGPHHLQDGIRTRRLHIEGPEGVHLLGVCEEQISHRASVLRRFKGQHQWTK